MRRRRPRTPRRAGECYKRLASYHIVAVTFQREPLFGHIEDGEMVLNGLGQIVEEEWRTICEHYPYVLPGVQQVMPDHFHGLPHYDPRMCPPHLTLRDLSRVIGSFKAHSARRINELRGTPGVPVWARSFYGSKIRDERHRRNVERYIRESPGRAWEEMQAAAQGRGGSRA